MTDKQIIIDDQKKTIHRLQDECTEKTNAIIALGEQLTAKEQECEELKKQCELEKEMCTSWCDESYKDKEENIKLKEEIDNLKQYKSSKQASYEVLQKKCNELELKNRKYKAILTEIKEIAEPYYTLGSKDSPVAQILQKINELTKK